MKKNTKEWSLMHNETGEIIDVPDIATANDIIADKKDKYLRDHKSPYGNFYQVNRKYSSMFEDLIRDNKSAAILFQFLLNNMDGLNAVTCTTHTLCQCIGCSLATIFRNLKHLKENGYIDIKKNGSMNVYIVNPELCWSSWSKNMKYCEYASDVVITPSKKLRTIRRRKISTLTFKDETLD